MLKALDDLQWVQLMENNKLIKKKTSGSEIFLNPFKQFYNM